MPKYDVSLLVKTCLGWVDGYRVDRHLKTITVSLEVHQIQRYSNQPYQVCNTGQSTSWQPFTMARLWPKQPRYDKPMRVGASFTKRGVPPYVSTTLNPRRKQQKMGEGQAVAVIIMVILAFIFSWGLSPPYLETSSQTPCSKRRIAAQLIEMPNSAALSAQVAVQRTSSDVERGTNLLHRRASIGVELACEYHFLGVE